MHGLLRKPTPQSLGPSSAAGDGHKVGGPRSSPGKSKDRSWSASPQAPVMMGCGSENDSPQNATAHVLSCKWCVQRDTQAVHGLRILRSEGNTDSGAIHQFQRVQQSMHISLFPYGLLGAEFLIIPLRSCSRLCFQETQPETQS